MEFDTEFGTFPKLYKTSESELLHQDLLRLDFFKNIKQEALLIETKTKK